MSTAPSPWCHQLLSPYPFQLPSTQKQCQPLPPLPGVPQPQPLPPAGEADKAGNAGKARRTPPFASSVHRPSTHTLRRRQDKHDSEHQPRFHEGLVLKHNANQRYATNAVSAALFREVGKRRGVPCQEFCVRNDMPCGSTIGPILASALGCRTVDVGIAQLSMHSIREMCGTDDVGLAYRHFVAFFEDFGALDATLDIDALPPPNVLGTLNDVPCEHTGHGGAPREPPHPGLAKPSK
mmetsp:Transcript_27672/g.81941  ORF Transcript_27672/g.81941 Transcript_27672/m.81941 type:complete len:237 (-) Transcript_27672:758-1468(-)